MKLWQRLPSISPWVVVTICGCAALTAVDAWRGQGPTAMPVVRGTLPNLVAVPTLTFGFLMMRFLERPPHTAESERRQRRWFWALWVSALVVTVAWEFSQITGGLVYDPLDLVATGVGATVAVAVYGSFRKRSFAPAV